MQTTKSADEEGKPETRKSKNYQEKQQKGTKARSCTICHRDEVEERRKRHRTDRCSRSVAVADARSLVKNPPWNAAVKMLTMKMILLFRFSSSSAASNAAASSAAASLNCSAWHCCCFVELAIDKWMMDRWRGSMNRKKENNGTIYWNNLHSEREQSKWNNL